MIGLNALSKHDFVSSEQNARVPHRLNEIVPRKRPISASRLRNLCTDPGYTLKPPPPHKLHTAWHAMTRVSAACMHMLIPAEARGFFEQHSNPMRTLDNMFSFDTKKAKASRGKWQSARGSLELRFNIVLLALLAGNAHAFSKNSTLRGLRHQSTSVSFNRRMSTGLPSSPTVSAGGFHSCFTDQSNVLCWGLGSNGRLGYSGTDNIGDDEHPSAAGAVNLGTGLTATQVSAGASHTCAVLSSGDVMCWGYGLFGQLGYSGTDNIGDDEQLG